MTASRYPPAEALTRPAARPARSAWARSPASPAPASNRPAEGRIRFAARLERHARARSPASVSPCTWPSRKRLGQALPPLRSERLFEGEAGTVLHQALHEAALVQVAARLLGAASKLTLTVRDWSRVTSQVPPEEEAQPLHAPTLQALDAGVATRRTAVPGGKVAEQVDPQSMPGMSEVMRPLPASDTERTLPDGVKLALALATPASAMLQPWPWPAHTPPQALKSLLRSPSQRSSLMAGPWRRGASTTAPRGPRFRKPPAPRPPASRCPRGWWPSRPRCCRRAAHGRHRRLRRRAAQPGTSGRGSVDGLATPARRTPAPPPSPPPSPPVT